MRALSPLPLLGDGGVRAPEHPVWGEDTTALKKKLEKKWELESAEKVPS